MIKTVIAGIAAAGIAVTAYALPAQASTITARPAHSTAWYDQRAGKDFYAYLRHQSPRRLARLDADAMHADPFIRYDENVLYEDVRHGARRVVIRFDEWCLWVDFTMTPDQAASQ